MSDVTTRGIRVRATAVFLPDRSMPVKNAFVFTYRIVIENNGDDVVQLVSRHWTIINGDGHSDEVSGEGVVGESPVLAPGESFTYSSYCPLSTHWGTMEGTYTMENALGETFEVSIGRFFLVSSVSADAEVTE